MQKKQQNKKSCDLANNTDWETTQVVRIWTHIIQCIANGKCTWELQSLVVLHFKALWNMPYLTTFPTFYFQGSSVDNETIALFLKLIKRLHLARVVKHRFMNTSNSDYLQMLIKTHRTEKLPSFYVGICFPREKGTMLDVYPHSATASQRTMESCFSESWVRSIIPGCRWRHTKCSVSETVQSLLLSARFTSFSVAFVKLQLNLWILIFHRLSKV